MDIKVNNTTTPEVCQKCMGENCPICIMAPQNCLIVYQAKQKEETV